jgi:hypothetical protein
MDPTLPAPFPLPTALCTPIRSLACAFAGVDPTPLSAVHTAWQCPFWACARPTSQVPMMPMTTLGTLVACARHAGRKSSRLLMISWVMSTSCDSFTTPCLCSLTGLTSFLGWVSTKLRFLHDHLLAAVEGCAAAVATLHAAPPSCLRVCPPEQQA